LTTEAVNIYFYYYFYFIFQNCHSKQTVLVSNKPIKLKTS